jgi:hypothetical protein
MTVYVVIVRSNWHYLATFSTVNGALTYCSNLDNNTINCLSVESNTYCQIIEEVLNECR